MSTQIALRNTVNHRAANELSDADLDSIIGGVGAAPGPHMPTQNGSQNLLVVIAIIAILIG